MGRFSGVSGFDLFVGFCSMKSRFCSRGFCFILKSLYFTWGSLMFSGRYSLVVVIFRSVFRD